MIKIAVADDHYVVRRGLKGIIDENPMMKVCIEAKDGQDLLKQMHKQEINVIIIDIAMPGRSGLDILKQLKIEYPKLPVLVLSVYPEDQYAVRVLKAKASGYITKESAPEQLVKAILKVAKGGTYISSVTAELLNTMVTQPKYDKFLHEILSDREFDVMRMLGTGKTITGIAQELCLSVKTISTYRSRIIKKMKFRNNAEIMRYVLENELTSN